MKSNSKRSKRSRKLRKTKKRSAKSSTVSRQKMSSHNVSRRHSKPRRKERSRKPSPSRKRSGSLTKKQRTKRSGSITRKRGKSVPEKTPKHKYKHKPKKSRVPRGYKRSKPETREAHGFKFVRNVQQSSARDEIDRALSSFRALGLSLLPGSSWDVRVSFNRDGSVSGQSAVVGVSAVHSLEGEWEEFFGVLSNYDRWPFALRQTEEHSFRSNGAFWFSVEYTFSVPEGTDLEELDKRYKRHRGAIATSTHWVHTDRAAATLTSLASNITERLEQKKFGYKVQRVTFRLHWSEDGSKPNWS